MSDVTTQLLLDRIRELESDVAYLKQYRDNNNDWRDRHYRDDIDRRNRLEDRIDGMERQVNNLDRALDALNEGHERRKKLYADVLSSLGGAKC